LPQSPRLFQVPNRAATFEASTARERTDVCRQSFACRKAGPLLTTSERHSGAGAAGEAKVDLDLGLTEHSA